MRILMVSQLFVKSIGKAMKPWYKQIAQNSHLPSGIRSYDIVEGFSALKGNFKITSYKNLEGKLLYRTSEYADMGLINNKRFVYDDYLTYIETKTDQSGVLTRKEYKTFCNYDDGSVVELTEQIASTPLLDKQMVRYLKPGQYPRVINIDRPWGNAKMTSPNCTSKRLLMFNG